MPSSPDASIFKNAQGLRDSLTRQQQKEIQDLYKKWAEDIKKQADRYAKMQAGSAPVSQMYFQQLYKQIEAQAAEVASGVYTNISNGMMQVSDAVVKDMVEWTSKFGFPEEGVAAAFSNISQSVVNAILTGSIYGKPGSWSLSKSIWGDNQKTLHDIYEIISQGVVEQLSIQETAEKLSQYVSPTKQLRWSGPKGMRIYKKAVDYNAQRLARTLNQHAYQQAFVSATKDNPFIIEYVWRSNGSRACKLCKERDGKHFKKDELPLDHPNGMCVMEPVVDDKMVDKLANWVNSEDGTYLEIDEFAKRFGYDASKMPKMTLTDIKSQYGNSQYKSPNAWYKKLPEDVQQTVSQIHQASGKKWTQWYQDEIMDQSLKSGAKKAASSVSSAVKKAKNVTYKTFKNPEAAHEWTMENVYDEPWWNSLDEIDRRAITWYTGHGYEDMNAYLRGMVDSITDKDKEAIERVSDALSKTAIKENVVVTRGMGGDGAMTGLLNISVSELEQLLSDNPEGLVGMVMRENGFLSTTVDPRINAAFKSKYELKLNVPAGTHGAYIAPVTRFENEHELLLDKGTAFRIDAVKQLPGNKYRITATVVQ